MAPIFETAMLLAVAILPAALVSANCTANILNINEVVIATGCVPAGGNLIIRLPSPRSGRLSTIRLGSTNWETTTGRRLRLRRWQTVLKIFTSQVNHKDADEISPIAKMNGALEDPKVDKMFSGFAALLEWFCIGRDYASKDPWGNQLNIKAENAVQAAVKQKYKDDLDAWEQLDDPTIPKPSKVNMQRANPAAYTIARLVSCFPNLLNAIDAWDKANPEAAVFAKGRTLRKDN
ncbi:hypothetical protein L13192_05223 [Pyrenophora tritici-repentis]|nr:hypothetical protein L13192_05223 [Pyrenophora tritici-repentis]